MLPADRIYIIHLRTVNSAPVYHIVKISDVGYGEISVLGLVYFSQYPRGTLWTELPVTFHHLRLSIQEENRSDFRWPLKNYSLFCHIFHLYME